jgi:deoxyribodipyrimidine photo-lyase
MQQEHYGLHWFRRDLRVAGNPALHWSWKEHRGRVLGVFCFDRKFLSRSDFSTNRFQFFLETLRSLQSELEELGSGLLILDVGPDEAYSELLERLSKSQWGLPASVSWNRDYEPFAIERDQRMQGYFTQLGIRWHHERDHQLIEAHEIIKESDPQSPYQVYSPFARQWAKSFAKPEVQARIQIQKKGLAYLENRRQGHASERVFHLRWRDLLEPERVQQSEQTLKHYLETNGQKVTIPLPRAGSLAAYETLLQFSDRIDDYHKLRDLPAQDGTSRFSHFIKNGSLTIAQIVAALDLGIAERRDSGRAKFLSELVWREFYVYILQKFPHVETTAFNARFRNLAWENREDFFAAWKEGRTGFPIVDAGMRELNTTGWMHNRVRMIVASFLTKDLLIDWRWGERYFMEKLLDGDLAPNNGGWQWAASTGCDPQPYFRIFNPTLQSKKFDPEGHYIRRFIPELARCSAREIHEPKGLSAYPRPIVDHAQQRSKALALYGVPPGKKGTEGDSDA